MKKLLFISALPLLFFLTSCDKITDPIVKRAVVGGCTHCVKKDNVAMVGVKKTLLEDYTGQACTFCPDAAIEATNLSATYGEKLVVMAVHAGSFAKPTTTYTNDFRTPAGDIWVTYFVAPGFPTGMINRTPYSGTSTFTPRPSWAGAVSQATAEPLIVTLEVSTQYDTVTRVLETKVKGSFLSALNSNIQITAVLTEDGIIGKQLNHGTVIDDYLFEHLVRGTITDQHIWGHRLKTAPIVANSDTTLNIPALTIKPEYSDRHLAIVLFAADAVTRKVYQAEKIKIR